MSANTFGTLFKVMSFGESHGPAYGVVIEGCPAGVHFDHELLNKNLERRKPGQSSITTSRSESDRPEILSGVFENNTMGTPICILVKNKDQRSNDYNQIKVNSRNGHADDVWKNKFGISDHRGGGRSSGRETLCRVIAGSVAQMLCQQIIPEMQVKAFAKQIGPFSLTLEEIENIWSTDMDQYKTRFPTKNEHDVVNLLEKAKVIGESYGGVIQFNIKNHPAGLGQPIFHKFKSDLALAMTSIGAVVGFEFGGGFQSMNIPGTKYHEKANSEIYGGIRGGITTAEEITASVAFKPTSSINDIAQKGRHDPCIIPRAVPVVEAMAWLTLADHLLWTRLDRVRI